MRVITMGILLAAAGRAAAEPQAPSDFLAVWGARGPSSLVGYVSSAWHSATTGPRTGQSLWTYDVASLKGLPVNGGGILLGARSGVVTGTLEYAHLSMETAAQVVWVEAAGQLYDPVDGYFDLESGDVGFPAGYFGVTVNALFVNGNVALSRGPVEPYAGAGLGVSVMSVSSRALAGADGRDLDATRIGIAFQLAAGLRVAPWPAAFLWIEFRPGWHVMGTFEKGTGYDRSKDQFILQVLPVVAGVGWSFN